MLTTSLFSLLLPHKYVEPKKENWCFDVGQKRFQWKNIPRVPAAPAHPTVELSIGGYCIVLTKFLLMVAFPQMVLLPSAESVSIFQGPDGEQRKKQFDRFRCLDYHLSATRPRPRLPDVCKRLIFAMSSVIYDGGQRKFAKTHFS